MEDTAPLPQYKEILEETARQLNARKGLFLRRIAFVVWPLVILGIGMVVIYVTVAVPFLKVGFEGYEAGPVESGALYAIWGVCAYLVFALFWILISSTLFSIEKNIWTDSFFDGVALSSEQSWRMSKRLFFSIVRLKLLLILRYTIPALLGAALLGWLLFKATPLVPMNPVTFAFVWIMVPITLFAIYIYVIGIKLRYVWFLFLDLYGTEGYSSRNVLKAALDLNQKIKSVDLKKVLAVQFGVEGISMVIASVAGVFTSALRRIGPSGKYAEGIANTAVAIVDSEIREYALIIGNYMLYRAVWYNLYGTYPRINEHVYELAN